MKLLSVIGTRLQFIKIYPLLKRSLAKRIQHMVVNTGQHYDYELDVTTPSTKVLGFFVV